ncbi:MAG: hypothetical protein AAF703_10885 [Cyanobacteria bacterium P01_D01_bin.105]
MVELPSAPADADDQIASACASHDGNQFIASGRGGIPISPNAILLGNRPWQDLRPLPSPNANNAESVAVNKTTTPIAVGSAELATTLQEASGWQMNSDGNVELLLSVIASHNITHPTCLNPAA